MTAPDPALQRAWALLETGRPEQALRELAGVPAGQTGDARVLTVRAEAYAQLDRWSDAIRAAQDGLAAGGPSPTLLALLGSARSAIGDYQQAERAYLDGLREDPVNVRLLCRYALLCLVANQVDKADGLLSLAAEQDPQHPMVHFVRVQLAFVRDGDRAAERASREFLGAYPDHTTAHALHGWIAANRGRPATAFASFRKAVANDPTEVAYAQAAREARITAHPLLLPLRPLYRFGSIATWLVAVGVVVGSRALGYDRVAAVAGGVWLVYAAYSWLAPPVVRRLVPEVGPPSQRRGLPGWQWAVGVVILLVGLGCLGLGGSDIGPQVRAAHGSGTPGTVVLTERGCGLNGCSWHGDFTSDDGSVVRRNTVMRDDGVPADAKAGDRLPAIDTGARVGVFPPTGSTEWIYAALYGSVGAVVVIAWIVWFPVLTLVRRRW